MRRVLGGIAVIIIIAVAAVIWFTKNDQLTKLVNAQFPPVKLDDHRQQAMRTALAVLGSMQPANIAVGLDTKDIHNVLMEQEVIKQSGITKIELHANDQLLRFDVRFERQFDGSDLSDETKALLSRWKPAIVGDMTLFIGVTSGLSAANATSGVIRLQLLPVFKTIKVDSVTLFEKRVDVTQAAKVITDALNRYADNITEIISGLDVMTVKVPTTIFDPVDPSRTLTATGPNGEKIKLVLTSQPIFPPAVLSAIAWVVDNDRLQALARFDMTGSQAASIGEEALTLPTSADMPAIHDAASKHLASFYPPGNTRNGVWAAVSKALLAQSLNSIIAQAQPCLDITGSLPKIEFNNIVDFPDEKTIDCTPTRDCTFNNIDCTPTKNCSNDHISCPLQHDTRPCRVCTRYKILQFHGLKTTWGWTETCVNEPTCEFAKAAQNKAYEAAKLVCEADKAAWKLDCEQIKNQEKLGCEAGKAAKKFDCEQIKTSNKALCETEKEGLKRLSRTGKFGRIQGHYSGEGALRVCVLGTNFTDTLQTASINLANDGRIELPIHVKFTPLDIVGHLTCYVPWTEDQTLHVKIPHQQLAINARVAYAEKDGQPRYSVQLDPIKIKAKMDPDPTELLLRSTNFMLSCSLVANIVTPTAVWLKPFIPELNGNFEQEFKGQALEYVPQIPTQTIGTRKLKVKFEDTGTALLLFLPRNSRLAPES